MAEPLSIAASIAGLLSLGVQVVDSLFAFYSSFKSQDVHVKRLTSNLEELSTIFHSLQTAIEHQRFREEEKPLLERVEAAISNCDEIINELNEALEKFKNSSNPDLKDRLKTAGSRLIYPFRKRDVDKLGIDIREIRENISFALDTLQLTSTGYIRNDVEEIKTLVTQMRSAQISKELMDWLQAPHINIDHSEACAKASQGSGRWLLSSADFRSWFDGQDKSFLWINGFAGCGKTVLCSTIIQHIQRHKEISTVGTIGIAFFYCSFNDSEKTNTLGLLRVIFLQLASQLTDGDRYLERLRSSCEGGNAPVAALIVALQEIMQKFREVYIIIDALDECPQDGPRESVLSLLLQIFQWDYRLHMLVTSRDVHDVRTAIQHLGLEISMQNEGVNEDIRNFVTKRLEESIQLRRWSAYHDRIKEVLVDRAQGMFQMVECQLRALANCPRSKAALEKRLASLPQSLDETYERMLSDIDDDFKQEARRILTLLCFASRPLTVSEVIDAVAVDVEEDGSFDVTRRLTDELDILNICPGFISLGKFIPSRLVFGPWEDDWDEIDRQITLRIAHFSIQEYLESERIRHQNNSYFSMNKVAAHAEITRVCLTYLLDPVFSAESLSESNFNARPLCRYAARCWHYHYENSRGMKPELMVIKFFQSSSTTIQNWLRIFNPDELYTAGHLDDVETMFPSKLYFASLLGLHQVLSMLLSAGFEVNSIEGVFKSPIAAAAFNGHQDIVKLLLKNGAEIGHADEFSTSAASAASTPENMSKAMKLLCETSFGMYLLSQDNGAPGRLSFGIYKSVVILAVEFVGDKRLQKASSSPLLAAAWNGHTEVVRLLLDHGAGRGNCGTLEHALQWASRRGHTETAKALLDGGADINAEGLSGRAIVEAFKGGHRETMEFLASRGAVFLLPENDNELINASKGQPNEQLVQSLVEGRRMHLDRAIELLLLGNSRWSDCLIWTLRRR